MCGRAVQARTEKFGELIAHWLYPETFEPRWNLRPTEPAWIVARRSDGATRTIQAKWWCQWDGARQFETKFPMFNARVETMYDRKLWADLLQRGQRCIFPVNSFYEWPIKGKGLPPVEIFVEGQDAYGLAGLWSRWFEGSETRYSFTVFTTEPNEFMKPIHEKAMPVILADIDSQERWLTEGDESVLRPFEGNMTFTQLDSTLEKLYPDENMGK